MESKTVELLFLIACIFIQATFFMGYIGVLILGKSIQKTLPKLKESIDQVVKKSEISKYKVLTRIVIAYFLSLMVIQILFVQIALFYNWHLVQGYIFLVDLLFFILIPFLVYFILKGKKESPLCYYIGYKF